MGDEIVDLQSAFNRYDADGSGDISNRELIVLVEECFADMAHDEQMRPHLAELMSEVDADKSGSLDFSDFIRLMQQLRELKDREQVAKEQQAVRETEFTPGEVNEFRELFLSCETSSGKLSLHEIRQMLEMICPMGDRNSAELTAIFHSITTRTSEDHRNEADFPEFLWIMRKLLDMNFANIRERTSGECTR